jgi:putative transcriptional regulator
VRRAQDGYYSQVTPQPAPKRSATWLPRSAVCALLFLLGAQWPAAAEDAKALTAIMLVARSELPDPNFADSVLLVMNNLGPAPIGIVVNKPSRVAVSELFPDLKRLSRLRDKVYYGGPVDFGSVWFLFRAATLQQHAIQVFDGVWLSANRDLLLQLLGRDKPMEGLRIFVGHAGWGPGQLEAEINRGDWTLERADSGKIFNAKPEHPHPKSPMPEQSI